MTIVQLSDIRGITLPDNIPMEMGILHACGIEPGTVNVYGTVYRDTYTYDSAPISWSNDYNIVLVDDTYDSTIFGVPDIVIHKPTYTSTIYINRDILIKHGYMIPNDWSSTIAWGESGDWGSIYINIRNRQGRGIICPTKYHDMRRELSILLSKNNIEVILPDQLWKCTGIPPDIMVRSPGCYISGDI